MTTFDKSKLECILNKKMLLKPYLLWPSTKDAHESLFNKNCSESLLLTYGYIREERLQSINLINNLIACYINYIDFFQGKMYLAQSLLTENKPRIKDEPYRIYSNWIMKDEKIPYILTWVIHVTSPKNAPSNTLSCMIGCVDDNHQTFCDICFLKTRKDTLKLKFQYHSKINTIENNLFMSSENSKGYAISSIGAEIKKRGPCRLYFVGNCQNITFKLKSFQFEIPQYDNVVFKFKLFCFIMILVWLLFHFIVFFCV